jgi:hypothetical protein
MAIIPTSPSWRGCVASSFVVAGMSASTGYLLPISNYQFLRISEALDLVWVAIVVVTIAKFRWRGLLALIALPLVMWWPIGLRLLVWLCNQGYNACI